MIAAMPYTTSSLRTLARAYRYLRPHSRLVVGAYGTLLAIIALNLAVPQFIRWIIDEGIKRNSATELALAVLALLALALLKGGLTFLQGRWSETASQNVAFDLRNAIQRKLTLLSFSFLSQNETGDLLSRTMQDVERIRALTGRATLRILNGLVLLTATAVALWWMNSSLAFVVLLLVPLLAQRALYFGTRARPLSLAIQRQLAALTTRIEQNLRGVRVVKAFAQERAEIARFDAENDTWFNLTAQNVRLEAINVPLMNLLANLGSVIVLWYGGSLVIQNQLTLGELVAFTTYLAQLVQPIRLLGTMVPLLAMGSAAAERIFQVLDTVPDVRDAPNAQALTIAHGRVAFEDVTFAYGTRAILQAISFVADAGKIIALLGATGSGKSTLISLVPRFYDPTAGRVTIDGADVRAFQLTALRAQIGIVLQDSVLFARTIRENIAFGCPAATPAQIEQAARAAQAHEFILGLPNGYDTDVGERGVTLSGGQKQRLAIARALLTNPRILILDDATSSVDTETEHHIQRALDQLMRGRTTFVIAHRLSTLQRADLILVLEQGRIAACGTHETLLRDSALYAEIYERQLKVDA